jgi:Family of unknown function (DUF5678)
MNAVYTEILEKASNLTDTERNKLIQLLQKQAHVAKPNNKKKFVLHPNTVWIKANHDKYAGNYVALKDGKFIASGKTIKEANEKARSLGVEKPFLHYIIAENEDAWGGW